MGSPVPVVGCASMSSIALAANPNGTSSGHSPTSNNHRNDRISESVAVETTEDSSRMIESDGEVDMEIDDDDALARHEVQLDIDEKMEERLVQGDLRVVETAGSCEGIEEVYDTVKRGTNGSETSKGDDSNSTPDSLDTRSDVRPAATSALSRDPEGRKLRSSNTNSIASSSIAGIEIEMSTSANEEEIRKRYSPATLSGLGSMGEGVPADDEEDGDYRAGNLELDYQRVESEENGEGLDEEEEITVSTKKGKGKSTRSLSSKKITFMHFNNFNKQCEKLSKEKVLVLPTVQNGIAFKSHEDFRMHHVVAARQRGWSSHVAYTKVNRFALSCSHGKHSTGPSCTYRIIVERQLINGNMAWIAVREMPHTSHTPSTGGKLGKFTTDAMELKGKNAELSDKEDSGSNAEATNSDSKRKRSREEPTMPPTRSHEKKRTRIRSVSPPPKSRNAVASTSGSNSRRMDPASSISQFLKDGAELEGNEEGLDEEDEVIVSTKKGKGTPTRSSSSKKITFMYFNSLEEQCEKMSKEKVLVLPTVQNGIAIKSHEDFRRHHVVAARQRGWSSYVVAGYTKVNRFALRCSYLDNTPGANRSSCSYHITVERQSINGNMVWIAVEETGHTSHTPSAVGKLGKFKTDAMESNGKGRKNVELSDKDDSGSDNEAIQPDSNRERSRDKPTSPPIPFHDEKKRPRIRSVSPPPQSRNAVASTSGSNSSSVKPASSISHPSPGPIPRVSPTPHWSQVQHQPAHPVLPIPIPAQSHPRYQSHPTPPVSVTSLPITRRSTHELMNNLENDRSFSVAEGTGYANTGHLENISRNNIIPRRSDPSASTLNSLPLHSLASPSLRPTPIDVPVEKLARNRGWAFVPAASPTLAPHAAASSPSLPTSTSSADFLDSLLPPSSPRLVSRSSSSTAANNGGSDSTPPIHHSNQAPNLSSDSVNRTFLEVLSEFLESLSPRLGIYASLFVTLGISSKEELDEVKDYDDEMMNELCVALIKGVDGVDGMPIMVAKKLIYKLKSLRSC